jgi:hypothetical protein
MRKILMVVATAALLPVPSAGASVTRDVAPGWQVVRLTFQPVVLSSSPAPPVCNPNDPTLCVYPFVTTDADQTGDLQGKTVEVDTYSTTGSGIVAWQVSGTFSGSVRSCGSGTFLYSAKKLLPVSDLFSFVGEYVVDPGTGTGDFVGLTGTITGSPAGGPYTATFRCRRVTTP